MLRVTLDHWPIILTQGSQSLAPSSFHIENMWLWHLSFKANIFFGGGSPFYESGKVIAWNRIEEIDPKELENPLEQNQGDCLCLES